VQPEIGAALVGLDPQELAAPVRRGQPPPDERGRDLARRMRAADVGVSVVDCDDLPAERALDLLPRALGSGKLRHF
jgi:hypothetical protein